MARTDTHRPSAINPAEYDFVALGNIKIEHLGDCYEQMYHRKQLEEHMARTGGKWSSHQHGGNCHICGAHCCWTVIFYHAKTNTYIRTGTICADKLEMAYDHEDLDRFKRSAATAEKNRAGKAKAKLLLEEYGLAAAWDRHLQFEEMDAARRKFHEQQAAADQAEFEKDGDWDAFSNRPMWYKRPGCPEDPSANLRTLNDMVVKLITYGGWSEKQKDFAGSLLDRLDRQVEIDAARAAEAAAAAPVPETDKRIQIEGDVLSTKVVETMNGHVMKVLVKTDAGWKCWGTRPVSGLERGQRIRFMARIQPSKDDPKFGFFSRPTRGEVVA